MPRGYLHSASLHVDTRHSLLITFRPSVISTRFARVDTVRRFFLYATRLSPLRFAPCRYAAFAACKAKNKSLDRSITPARPYFLLSAWLIAYALHPSLFCYFCSEVVFTFFHTFACFVTNECFNVDSCTNLFCNFFDIFANSLFSVFCFNIDLI